MLQMGLPWMRSASWWMQGRYCTGLLLISCMLAFLSFRTTYVDRTESWKSSLCKSVTTWGSNACNRTCCMIPIPSSLNMNIPGIPYMPVFKAPLWLCEGVRIVCWLVGWLVGNWVRRQENVNGFLNSAEQPFAKVCWTSVLLSWGLQLAVHSGSVAGSYRHPHTHTHNPPPCTKHTYPHSPCMSYSQSEVWTVSSVTPLRSPFIVADKRCWPE